MLYISYMMDENAQESSNGNAISIFKTYPIVNLKTSEKKVQFWEEAYFLSKVYINLLVVFLFFNFVMFFK